LGVVAASLAIATSSARLPAKRIDEFGRLAVEGAEAISERLGWRATAGLGAVRGG
jgi:DNA-binding IclR family transcriptional regulator